MSDEKDNVIRVQFGAKPEPAAPAEPVEVPPEHLDKLQTFTEMLEKGTVLLTLDARSEDAQVPAQFSEEMRLNLNFCYGFGIPDFEFDELGVRASLSFGGRDFYCDIPWGSVYMLRSHVENDAMLFPGAIPPEMLAFLGALQEEE